jgi:hypothetical protein
MGDEAETNDTLEYTPATHVFNLRFAYVSHSETTSAIFVL